MSVTTRKQGSKIDFSGEIENTLKAEHGKPERVERAKRSEKVAATVAEKTNAEKTAEKKIGRPSNGEMKKMSISISADLYEGLEMGATLFFKGNKTAYINALIKRDLEENLENYRKFRELVARPASAR